MVSFSHDSSDFDSEDTIADDGLFLAPGEIALLYAQIRNKFPGKQFPEDASLQQMAAVVLAFRDGAEMARVSQVDR